MLINRPHGTEKYPSKSTSTEVADPCVDIRRMREAAGRKHPNWVTYTTEFFSYTLGPRRPIPRCCLVWSFFLISCATAFEY